MSIFSKKKKAAELEKKTQAESNKPKPAPKTTKERCDGGFVSMAVCRPDFIAFGRLARVGLDKPTRRRLFGAFPATGPPPHHPVVLLHLDDSVELPEFFTALYWTKSQFAIHQGLDRHRAGPGRSGGPEKVIWKTRATSYLDSADAPSFLHSVYSTSQ
ncbi:MAG: hypothetical protein Q9157_003545 [Trypethelium eluteriae]